MTVRELRNVFDDCWFRLLSDHLEDENGDYLVLFEEAHHAIFPDFFLDREVKWACVSDDGDLRDYSSYVNVYI